jgi:prevent-host-death family protein
MSTETFSLFEAKAHFSHLVQEVAESHNEVVVTVRGLPKVRIVPYDTATNNEVWEVRERLVAEYGEFDLTLPPRRTETVSNPLGDGETL